MWRWPLEASGRPHSCHSLPCCHQRTAATDVLWGIISRLWLLHWVLLCKMSISENLAMHINGWACFALTQHAVFHSFRYILDVKRHRRNSCSFFFTKHSLRDVFLIRDSTGHLPELWMREENFAQRTLSIAQRSQQKPFSLILLSLGPSPQLGNDISFLKNVVWWQDLYACL